MVRSTTKEQSQLGRSKHSWPAVVFHSHIPSSYLQQTCLLLVESVHQFEPISISCTSPLIRSLPALRFTSLTLWLVRWKTMWERVIKNLYILASLQLLVSYICKAVSYEALLSLQTTCMFVLICFYMILWQFSLTFYFCPLFCPFYFQSISW